MEAAVLFVMVLFLAVLSYAAFPRAASDSQKRDETELCAWPSVPPHPNAQLLHAVRSRSCYSGLRALHGFITVAAIVLCALAWLIVLFSSESNAASRIFASSLYGALIVGVLIERGLFTLIVDAVDVLIDSSRRAQERDGDGAAE